MAPNVARASQAMSDERFARVRPTQAKASLPEPEPEYDSVIFECVEATARKWKLSDKEISALLRISQTNYARRKYNGARVQFLNLEMRRYFIHCYAKTVGLKADAPTPQEQLRSAAKIAVMTLLDLMEGA